MPLENKDHQVPQVRLASRVLKAPQAPEALRAEQDPPEQEDSRDPEDHEAALAFPALLDKAETMALMERTVTQDLQDPLAHLVRPAHRDQLASRGHKETPGRQEETDCQGQLV